MTKPFEPVDPILFYMADDHLEEDVYMSKGRYRRYWWESKRISKPGSRKKLKRLRLKLTRHNLTRMPQVESWGICYTVVAWMAFGAL